VTPIDRETNMDTVAANGTVRRTDDDDRLVLVPSGPTGPDHPMALDLLGPDLPPESLRVVVEGELDGRSLRVARWRREPAATSAWGPVPEDYAGVSPDESTAILNSVSDDWPLISTGEHKTPGGNFVVRLQVERVTPEIRRWYEQQPPGSVHLVSFIDSPDAPRPGPWG